MGASQPYNLDQGAFMTTHAGHRVHLANPSVEEIDIEDIAHALSHICRFTGHTKRFYSVAEHCLLASLALNHDRALAREALLHDAHEAYCNDLSRPIKNHPGMEGYAALEHRIDAAIRLKFGLPPKLSPEVKAVDDKLVVEEARQLLTDSEWASGRPGLGVTLDCHDSRRVKAMFLHRWANLGS